MHISLPNRYRAALVVVALLCLLATRQAAWAAPWTAPLNQTVPTRTKVYTATSVHPATATYQPTVAPTQAPPTVAPTQPPPTGAPPTSAPGARTATPAPRATLAPPNLPTTGGGGDWLWLAAGALLAASILLRIAVGIRPRRAPRSG